MWFYSGRGVIESEALHCRKERGSTRGNSTSDEP